MACATKRKGMKRWRHLKTKYRWHWLFLERQLHKRLKRENKYLQAD